MLRGAGSLGRGNATTNGAFTEANSVHLVYAIAKDQLNEQIASGQSKLYPGMDASRKFCSVFREEPVFTVGPCDPGDIPLCQSAANGLVNSAHFAGEKVWDHLTKLFKDSESQDLRESILQSIMNDAVHFRGIALHTVELYENGDQTIRNGALTVKTDGVYTFLAETDAHLGDDVFMVVPTVSSQKTRYNDSTQRNGMIKNKVTLQAVTKTPQTIAGQVVDLLTAYFKDPLVHTVLNNVTLSGASSSRLMATENMLQAKLTLIALGAKHLIDWGYLQLVPMHSANHRFIQPSGNNRADIKAMENMRPGVRRAATSTARDHFGTVRSNLPADSPMLPLSLRCFYAAPGNIPRSAISPVRATDERTYPYKVTVTEKAIGAYDGSEFATQLLAHWGVVTPSEGSDGTPFGGLVHSVQLAEEDRTYAESSRSSCERTIAQLNPASDPCARNYLPYTYIDDLGNLQSTAMHKVRGVLKPNMSTEQGRFVAVAMSALKQDIIATHALFESGCRGKIGSVISPSVKGEKGTCTLHSFLSK